MVIGGVGGVIYSRGSLVSLGRCRLGLSVVSHRNCGCCAKTASRENRMTNQVLKVFQDRFGLAIVGDSITAWTTHQHPRQHPQRA